MRAHLINEEALNEESKGAMELSKLIGDLREKTFPKMSDDEVYEFMKGLKKWANQMLGETDNRQEDLPSHFGPRGDMDDKSWGDIGPNDPNADWRAQ